jgi:uncharacterized protein
MNTITLIGIDYGSRLAGTTSLAIFEPEQAITVYHTQKGEDADRFVLDHIKELACPCLVAIDAPLSLPGVYQNLPGYADYFYRVADRELKAMSPMFLGGLTARAIQLTAAMRSEGYKIIEAYPSALHLAIHEIKVIRQESPIDALPFFSAYFSQKIKLDRDIIPSKHAIDALCALIIAARVHKDDYCTAGEPSEGLIYY